VLHRALKNEMVGLKQVKFIKKKKCERLGFIGYIIQHRRGTDFIIKKQ
jgi:hypothetical protein